MSFKFRNTRSQYGLVSRCLHWISVVLLVTLIVTANNFTTLEPGQVKTVHIKQHASWGLLFLLVMLLRVYWRSMNLNPVHTYRLASWQKFAAVFLHRTIYVVVITQSIIGLLSLCFSGNGIPFFSVIESQALMDRDGILANLSNRIHYVLSIVIYPLFAMHISAAIYHQLLGVPDEKIE